jgi:squalene-associated FAD-dependent desaturase
MGAPDREPDSRGGTVHIIGAGLAGLSAAVELCGRDRRVVVHEAARFAGGRCRSYFEPALGLTIDNGNHLLLSGNDAARGFLEKIGAADALTGPPNAEFPFADAATGALWRLRLNDGPLPWWVTIPDRRVPGTRLADYLSLARLLPLPGLGPSSADTIADRMRCTGMLYDRLWQPVLLAALNTDPREASARLAGAVVAETFVRGGRACRPMVAAEGLSTAFVEPALAHLVRQGCEVRFDHRLRTLGIDAGRVARLEFAEGDDLSLGPADAVVLAVTAPVAALLLPTLTTPTEFRAIVNAHFRIAPPPGQPPLIGVVNAMTEWLFAFPDRLSVTISGAERLIETPRETLAADIWAEVARLTGLPSSPLPPWQIIKERRATFAATPEQDRRRPDTRGAGLANLMLAGDWTQTGLPATIEGAIRSGVSAAAALTTAVAVH